MYRFDVELRSTQEDIEFEALLGQGWVYLAIVMDLYSREIVGWTMSKRMTTPLIKRALQYAHAYRKPLEGYAMVSSMSGKGNCYDNAVVEHFFGSLNMNG